MQEGAFNLRSTDAHAMLSDLRSVLEADWHDNRPPLAFFCQGGDGRVFIVEPERVGVEEKRLLVGLEFFAEHDVTSYTFVMPAIPELL